MHTTEQGQLEQPIFHSILAISNAFWGFGQRFSEKVSIYEKETKVKSALSVLYEKEENVMNRNQIKVS